MYGLRVVIFIVGIIRLEKLVWNLCLFLVKMISDIILFLEVVRSILIYGYGCCEGYFVLDCVFVG